MKLRKKTNKDICNENNLNFRLITNVVEEESTKNKIRATSNLIAKALIATLGPYGSSTLIQDRQGNHFATKDGYDLMNRLSFEDELSRMILDMLRTTASSQVLSVGDGSTSAIVVANALYQALTDPERLEHYNKIAPKDILDILNDVSEIVEAELKKMAKPISEDMKELDTIAAVANNNDTQAGKLVADIYRQVGEHGFITMDVVDKQEKDTFELKNGIEWQRGYVDPIFEKYAEKDGRTVLDNGPKIFISNSTITYDDLELVLMPVMKHALNQQGAELLIIANDFDVDALNFLRSNRQKHQAVGQNTVELKYVAVDIDQVTVSSRNKLDDLALLANCRIYDKFVTQKADLIAHTGDFIGRATKVVATKKSTQVIFDNETFTKEQNKKIKSRISEIEEGIQRLDHLEVPTKEQDIEMYNLRQRLSNLTNSGAVLHVGGKTLAERMTRQRLIEDAVYACKSAIKYGYIPGGNLCVPKILIKNKEGICDYLGTKYDYLPIQNKRIFFMYFISTLADAFLESYRSVLSNSYLSEEECDEIIKKCLNENKFYNLKLHKYEDWDKTVVINSTYTDIQILRSCVSIIGILATSNQCITLGMNVVDNIDIKNNQ